jgi:streptogramin lyase
VVAAAFTGAAASAQEQIQGRVAIGGAPIVGAEVTAWQAGTEAPQRLVSSVTDSQGAFTLGLETGGGEGGALYLVARGGEAASTSGRGSNPATSLMTLVGEEPPATVTINELTTVASAWTAAQLLDGSDLRGSATALRIAARNVPNFVNLETGDLGPVISDTLNAARTTTLAKFNSLGLLLSGCATAIPDACDKLFEAATPPGGAAPTDTLQAAQNIARHPWHNADILFGLLDAFYPIPEGQRYRGVDLIPYLFFPPSAWTLSLVYGGGGFYGVGGAALDQDGNFWTNNNWLIGSQTTIFQQFGAGVGRFDTNGVALSPAITGYRGGGLDSPGWGIAFAPDDKVWVTNLIGKTISVLDRRTGAPLSPEGGYDFDGKLGQMQGVIVTPEGDIWTVDNGNSQINHIPEGDISQGRILGRTVDGKPEEGTLQVKSPFGIAIDLQDRILITNSGSDTVTRFPANDPANAEEIKVGFSPHAIAIDSLGNAWVGNLVGHPDTREKLDLVRQTIESKLAAREGSQSADDIAAHMWVDLWEIISEFPGGDVSVIQPDGTVLGPFNADGAITGPWGIAIDGNDNVWVASSTSRSVTQLCGFRTQTCPPGLTTGDPITPSEGYVGGLKIVVPIGVDPAGNVWVGNGWDNTESGFSEVPDEAHSTDFGANTIVVFFGAAKPVTTPVVGGQVRLP